jgi:hypothetical protein
MRKERKVDLPIKTIAIVVMIFLMIISLWYYDESRDYNIDLSPRLIYPKGFAVEKLMNNSEGQPVRTIEVSLVFSETHIEKNWLGKYRSVNRPFEGNIIRLEMTLKNGGQYVIPLDDPTLQTNDYLQNNTTQKAAFTKERNNGEKGWKAADGILTVKLNLEKSNIPINYSQFYQGMLSASVKDLPPGHDKIQDSDGLWCVVENDGFIVVFNAFKPSQ